jgi:hypothetical protein
MQSMVTLLNRLHRFEYGKQIHEMSKQGKEISGKLAVQYEEYYWKEMDRFGINPDEASETTSETT